MDGVPLRLRGHGSSPPSPDLLSKAGTQSSGLGRRSAREPRAGPAVTWSLLSLPGRVPPGHRDPSAAPQHLSAPGLTLFLEHLPSLLQDVSFGGGVWVVGTGHTAGAGQMPVDCGTLQAAGEGPSPPCPVSIVTGMAGIFGHSVGPGWLRARRDSYVAYIGT